MMTKGVIVFLKNPEIGKAKTRIASTAGPEKALTIYKELLSITHDIVDRVEAKRFLYYTHFINSSDLWENQRFIKTIQTEGGLGNKMKVAFSEVLKKVEKAIIIGSDCPYITPELINEGFDALAQNNVVIGPTFDGGYYLLGLKKVVPEIFEQIEFSTENVFKDTVSILDKKGHSYKILQQLHDVDYYDDWKAYLDSLSS